MRSAEAEADPTRQLERMRAAWNERGRAHPMRSICTGSPRSLSAEEFFASGGDEVEQVLAYVAGLGLRVKTGRALDFGCGLGRITQALGTRFDEAVGVDISDEMIRQANALSPNGARVRFVHNPTNRFDSLPDASFDFIIADLVFQHIDPRLSRSYLAELVRLLSPGGIAVLQIPGAVLRRGVTRSLVARRAGATYGLEPRDVEAIVESSRGKIITTRSSSLAYAGLQDILAANATHARHRGQRFRQRVWGILADKRLSIAYVIKKGPAEGAPVAPTR